MNEQRDTTFQSFLNERSEILKDIKQFLYVILKYVSRMVNQYKCDPKAVLAPKSTRSLIESLCLIHGLYGYPDANSSENSITVNKGAVREFVLNEINVNGMKFVDICGYASKDEFWQFGALNLGNSPREPAHLFLQLVRELFGDHEKTGELGREYLESLPDVNYLKPVVWAEHKKTPTSCGVSLGVRSFVRPLYLYIKLRELRIVQDSYTGVKLNDVIAYESNVNKKLLIKSDPTSNERTKWEKPKDPCDSCQVFFWFNTRSRRNFNPRFPPFGNCAEYDVIRTNNLDSLLRHIATTTDHWRKFEDACLRHAEEFHVLTANLEQGGDPSETMHTYHTRVGVAKILKYEMYTTSNNDFRTFKLIAEDWPIDQKQSQISKKRRKTTS